MLLGTVFGLFAAFFQSLSYLFSKIYTDKFNRGSLNLLIRGQIIMGVFSLILLPFIWPDTLPPLIDYIKPALSCIFFYFIGQSSLFQALKYSNASRVSPLLGIKIFILAIINMFLFKQSYSYFQWFAIFISLIAASVLSLTGEKISAKGFFWILMTTTGYSFSDINTRIVVLEFSYLGLVHGAMLATVIIYSLTGLISLPALFFIPKASKEMWIYSLPFSLSWFLAMLALFYCFGAIGVVYGSIIQASRGIISILLGILIAEMGYIHIEQKVNRRVILNRIIAALLMILSIYLFKLKI